MEPPSGGPDHAALLVAGVQVRLFDADGRDRSIDVTAIDTEAMGDRRLLWVDIDLDAAGSLDAVSDSIGLTPRERQHLETDSGRARLFHHTERWHLTLESVELDGPDNDDANDIALVRREIDLLAGPGVVVSAHRGPVLALERFVESLSGESSVGALRAADLLSSLADEVITGYHEVAERIERHIDRLDQVALDGTSSDRFLAQLVALRRRIGFARRTLAPHRAAFTALARPEMGTDEGVGQPWPGLVERIEGATGTFEALRDALLGTYDIHMGRAAQRANDVMKALTVLSALFLPGVVLAGLMGMNFSIPFFDADDNFYVVVGVMAVFAVLLLAVARWRSWI